MIVNSANKQAQKIKHFLKLEEILRPKGYLRYKIVLSDQSVSYSVCLFNYEILIPWAAYTVKIMSEIPQIAQNLVYSKRLNWSNC